MTVPSDVRDWLAFGERGISSNTIVSTLFGIDANKGWCGSYPHDPDDLTRCVKLIESCPSVVERFDLMRYVGPVWAGLVDAWPELVAMLNEEIPNWRTRVGGSAPKTYARMREIITKGEAEMLAAKAVPL